jgi:hypothetical protein
MQTNPVAKRTAEMTVSLLPSGSYTPVYTIKIKTKEMQAKALTQFACDLNVPLPALMEWGDIPRLAHVPAKKARAAYRPGDRP